MLDMNKCQLFETYHAPVLSTLSAIEEGVALVHVLEGGIGKVKPSAAGTGQKFAGVAIGRSATPTIVPYFELKAVPSGSPYTVALSKVQSGSSIRVTHIAANGTRTLLAAGAASNADEYSISSGVITVNSSKASGTLELSYNYAISLQEAIYKYNFNQLGSSNVADTENIGVCSTGIVFTDRYDVTSDFSGFTGANLYITANGLFTMTSSGNTAVDSAVISIPTAGEALLGLHLHP